MESIDKNIQDIVDYIENDTGFSLNDRRREKLSLLIRRRITETGMAPEDYLSYIQSVKGSIELYRLVSILTVGETYFFRNDDHWQALKEYVLPEIRSRNGSTSLKIWSAGCSTGEEAYSIAISLWENFYYHQNLKPKIFATDINQTSLEIAIKGYYSRNSFRNVDQRVIDRYFDFADGRYKIKDYIRRMIHFDRLSLMTPRGFPAFYDEFSVIFCRNVLMYFKPLYYTEICKKLADSLTNGGFLFLGHAETNIAPASLFRRVRCCNTLIYQKNG